MRDSKKLWKFKRVINIPRRIIYSQMIINCTYSSLVVTIALSLWVLLLLNWYRHVRDSTKIRRLKQHLELGEVERNILNEKEVRQCDCMMHLKGAGTFLGLFFWFQSKGTWDQNLCFHKNPCFYEIFLLIFWEKSLIQSFAVFWSDFKKL